MPELWGIIESSNLLSSFLADILSGLLLLVSATIIIPVYLDWRKRPRLNILFRIGKQYNDVIDLSKPPDDLSLNIKNSSPCTFNTAYWSIYFPKELNPQLSPLTKRPFPEVKPTPDGNYVKFSGEIVRPIFPHRIMEFPANIIFHLVNGEWAIYYFFSTDRGISPSRAKKVVNCVNLPSMSDTMKYLDKLTINIDG